MKILLPIIAHFLGDFMFQSSEMTIKKRESPKYFICHWLIYSAVMLLALVWFAPWENVVYAGLIILFSHALIDYIRILVLKRLLNKQGSHKVSDFVLFIIDQVLHIFIILGCTLLLREASALGQTLLDFIPLKELYNGLIIVLLYLLCLTPAAVLIKKIFVLFSIQNDEEPKTKEDPAKNGYLIGILERIIMLTLGLNGQLGAIGFVIAAKSLARFSQLNDKAFAEKYLIGTLLSSVIALLCIVAGNAALIKL